jgi:hypothetical protein
MSKRAGTVVSRTELGGLELAHIEQPRHTPAFWATVECVLPDYDRRRTHLATTGATLGSVGGLRK